MSIYGSTTVTSECPGRSKRAGARRNGGQCALSLLFLRFYAPPGLIDPEFHDLADQRVRNRCIERKFQIPLWPRISRYGGHQGLVTFDRRKKTNVLFEGREMDQISVLRERRDAVFDRFPGAGRRF